MGGARSSARPLRPATKALAARALLRSQKLQLDAALKLSSVTNV
jgi:hypothetical protein